MKEKIEPAMPQKTPYMVEVEAGKKYSWCACGRSQSQPFCDGSHAGTGMKSVLFEAVESKTVAFCGCKRSGNGVLCDGTHSNY